jgi:hypothetical protein
MVLAQVLQVRVPDNHDGKLLLWLLEHMRLPEVNLVLGFMT